LRTAFDASLQAAAVKAGAVELIGRANQPLWSSGRLDGFETGEGHAVRADFIIGADGATSRVATVTGLVDENRVLWGFAVRAYHPQPVDVPAIVLWEPSTWQGFPGYGWIFPGACGGANIGLGVGAQSDRTVGLRAVRALPAFLTHLRRLGLLSDGALAPSGRQLGGWLKMGMVGTRLAAGRVLLVGDAAGLVNPLQGEGIAQAMQSGRWAAAAVLEEMGGGRGGGAGSCYRASVMAAHLPYQRITSAFQGVLLSRPRAIAVLARSLTSLAHGNALTGGWSLFWSELLDGAPPGSPRTVATVLTRLGDYLTARTAVARWFDWESAFAAGGEGPVPAAQSGVSPGSSQT
jgi:menaquinone-9 beta-reductase